MPKLYTISDHKPGLADVYFDCPGCKCSHGVWTKANNVVNSVWSFNGDMNKPTFSPSILVRYPTEGKMHICHSFITNGMIQFLGDCTHNLAGHTVELPEQDVPFKTVSNGI